MALATALHLQRHGIHPAAVILLHWLPWGSEQARPIVTRHMRHLRSYADMDDDQLTAIGRYLRLAADWQVTPLTTPVLLVNATATPQVGPDSSGTAAPSLPPLSTALQDTITVTGDHITMVEEHAASTALAVNSWLIDILTPVDRPGNATS